MHTRHAVRLLQNAGDLRTEQRSRFEVFNLDSAKAWRIRTGSELDADSFDKFWDRLDQHPR